MARLVLYGDGSSAYHCGDIDRDRLGYSARKEILTNGDVSMKKYEYVRVVTSGGLFGGELQKHREIIDEYAERGYRYAGFIPTYMTSHGKIEAMDLVFEIEQS